MLGDTLTITLGGSGGTAKVLPKISVNGNSAEYYLREATEDFRAKVSHSAQGTRDRHYVEFKNTVFGTGDDPDTVRTVSMVILADPADTVSEVVDLVEGLAFWSDATTLPKVVGWES